MGMWTRDGTSLGFRSLGTHLMATLTPLHNKSAANCRATRASPALLERPFERAMTTVKLSHSMSTRV